MKYNFRILVHVRELGDRGSISISDGVFSSNPEKDYMARCEEMADEILKHVPYVKDVEIICDEKITDECEGGDDESGKFTVEFIEANLALKDQLATNPCWVDPAPILTEARREIQRLHSAVDAAEEARDRAKAALDALDAARKDTQ